MPLRYKAEIHPPEALFDMTLPVFVQDYAQAWLAGGDSWFSLGQVPSCSLLQGLRFDRSALIINCAQPGATVRNMVDWRRLTPFESLLGPGAGWRWTGILVSGGGNDLINALEHLLPALPADAAIAAEQAATLIDAGNFDRFAGYLRQNFADLIAWRDAPGSPNRQVPVYAHTYDYATPRDARGRFFGVPVFGPWLASCMARKNIPLHCWLPLAHALQGRLAAVLLGLDLPQLHVIDTRGILTPAPLDATLPAPDWSNEIHPSAAGYDKLGQAISRQLSTQMRADG